MLPIFYRCKTNDKVITADTSNTDTNYKSNFKIASGFCDRHDRPNLMLDDIEKTEPDIPIWGGENIYSVMKDMQKLRQIYSAKIG